MRLSEWAIYYQEPTIKNSWAFIEEFSYHNYTLYDSSFDEMLKAFWEKVVQTHLTLNQTGHVNWNPVDFYFTFIAKGNYWSFAIHAKDPVIYNKSFICTRDIYTHTEKIHPKAIDVECYFSNIKISDTNTLKSIFKAFDPTSTGNYIKIKM